MSYDENESSKVKADNPLTPKPDNSWMEALPLKRNPWDKSVEIQTQDHQENSNSVHAAKNPAVPSGQPIKDNLLSAWQSIETAPKDETRILVYFGERLGVREVHWTCLWSDDVETNGGWHVDDRKHGPFPLRGYSDGDDTHWMPLPAPPNPN